MRQSIPRGAAFRDLLPALLMTLAAALPILAWGLASRPGQAVLVVLAPGDRAEQAALRLVTVAGRRTLRPAGPWLLPALIAMPEPEADSGALRQAARGLLLNASGLSGCAPPVSQGS